VLDVGAQSTRAIKLRQAGKVRSSRATTSARRGPGLPGARGRSTSEISLEELGNISLRAEHPQPISSVCAVLAESEIINHVSAGQSVENIVRGIHDALASRAQSLLSRVGLESELTLVGGVALQAGAVRAVEARTGLKVNVPDSPETVGALGAALLALQRLEKRGGTAAA
jgi:activator of 2-hydroxyglutaryl-CoA dehydratase